MAARTAKKSKTQTKSQIEQYRTMLLKRREELAQAFRSNAQGAPANSLQGATGDSADHAASDYMAELFGALLEKQAGTLEEVELALAKTADGTYGICEDCDEKIAAKRLKAIPWARLCRDCRENQDRAAAVRRFKTADKEQEEDE